MSSPFADPAAARRAARRATRSAQELDGWTRWTRGLRSSVRGRSRIVPGRCRGRCTGGGSPDIHTHAPGFRQHRASVRPEQPWPSIKGVRLERPIADAGTFRQLSCVRCFRTRSPVRARRRPVCPSQGEAAHGRRVHTGPGGPRAPLFWPLRESHALREPLRMSWERGTAARALLPAESPRGGRTGGPVRTCHR